MIAMATLEDELAELVKAVTLTEAGAILFAGQAVGLGPPEWPHSFDASLPPTFSGLHYQLYSRGYCLRFVVQPIPAPAEAPDPGFRLALSAANTGRSRMDSDWRIVGPALNGQFWLQKDGLTRAAWSGAFIAPSALHRVPQPDDACELFWPHESWDLQPGSYFAFGVAIPDSVADREIVRFYWHCPAAVAPALLRELVCLLNRFQVPFRCKCPAEPARYNRRDAVVLYVSRRDYTIAAMLVAQLYAQFGDQLLVDTPLFARQLAPGLALAEDPANGESFGQHRCRLLAQAIWHTRNEATATGPQRLRAIYSYLAAAGIDFSRPHLNAGTLEDYMWPPS